jgi:polyhydroxyalkanoate synthase
MRLSNVLDPTYMMKRLGAFDALPNAIARATGALSLFATMKEPAPVAPTPFDVVAIEGSSRLLRYRRQTPAVHATPIVMSPSIINRFYILDLMHGTSVVEALLEQGFEVYMCDWGDPLPSEENNDLAFYALGRLRRFVDAARADTGADDVHLFGQCLGGTMATILAAVDPAGIRTLTNLTAPLSFHDDGILSAWSRAPFFDATAFAELYGNIPTWITQPSFVILKPMGHSTKLLRLFQNMGDAKFLHFFRCLETWINDNVAIPRAFYIDLIERLYREDALAKGTLVLRGHPVVLEEVRVPVLTLSATDDHIVPVKSATIGHDRFSSTDKLNKVIEGGHIGIVVGGRGKRTLYPLLGSWLGERSAKRASTTTMKSTEQGA